jgi:hypothetical protein
MQAQAAAAQNLLVPEFFRQHSAQQAQFSAKAKGKDCGGWGCC